MKIALTIPKFGPESGGVGSVVVNLANQLERTDGLSAKVLDYKGGEKYPGKIPLNSYSSLPPGLSFSLSADLRRSGGYDVIHHHGVWHPISASILLSLLAGGPPTICSPHGMLEPWIINRGKLKKTIAKVYEKPLWKRLKCFHALTLQEAESIKQIAPKTPVFYIPNGVNLSDNFSLESAKAASKTILYFGRFHQKKGIKLLLKAWSRLGDDKNGYKLKLVGWGDMEEVEGAEKQEGVEILPPVFNPEERDSLLAEADFLILPSFSEGLPMAILEAWSQGTPTIMTEECNLPAGFKAGASIKIAPQENSIFEGLRKAIQMPLEDRQKMSHAAYSLCESNYSMLPIMEKMVRMYRWASGENVDVKDLLA